ncbi:MAG: YggS family pyridoxal phosphate-dependent enzyme [Gammaproteobacteria bacterium]|nr:MAG: YggS family pyridoxal phosphate-dependent enzyme [Gammaproteobacteria bacterium]
MNDIQQRFDIIMQRLHNAAQQYQTAPPLLLAVSKKHSVEAIKAMYQCGQRAFGESYVQEALEKQQQLAQLDIQWHFIGPIQSNKTKSIANHFDWVHSVDRLKVARRLSEQRSANLSPLNICIQINIDNEAGKAGVLPADAVSLCNTISTLPQLKIRGLMCIPKKQDSLAAQRATFSKVVALFTTLKQADFPDLDTLSMGMSNDYEAAIAEGATIVRIGTALFGPRI